MDLNFSNRLGNAARAQGCLRRVDIFFSVHLEFGLFLASEKFARETMSGS